MMHRRCRRCRCYDGRCRNRCSTSGSGGRRRRAVSTRLLKVSECVLQAGRPAVSCATPPAGSRWRVTRFIVRGSCCCCCSCRGDGCGGCGSNNSRSRHAVRPPFSTTAVPAGGAQPPPAAAPPALRRRVIKTEHAASGGGHEVYRQQRLCQQASGFGSSHRHRLLSKQGRQGAVPPTGTPSHRRIWLGRPQRIPPAAAFCRTGNALPPASHCPTPPATAATATCTQACQVGIHLLGVRPRRARRQPQPLVCQPRIRACHRVQAAAPRPPRRHPCLLSLIGVAIVGVVPAVVASAVVAGAVVTTVVIGVVVAVAAVGVVVGDTSKYDSCGDTGR